MTELPRQEPIILSDTLPQPTGIVVVKICVSAAGDVISTEYLPASSSTSDTVLIKKAIKQAKIYRFSPEPDQKIQCGTITFNFKEKK